MTWSSFIYPLLYRIIPWVKTTKISRLSTCTSLGILKRHSSGIKMVKRCFWWLQDTIALIFWRWAGSGAKLLYCRIYSVEVLTLTLQTIKDARHCITLQHGGNIDAAALLLTRGCQFSTINKRGWTAVDYSYTPELAAHIRKLAHATYHERSTQKKNVPVMTGFTSS